MPLALCHGPVAKGFFVMKTQGSPAIIMRVREIRESDLLVIFFSRDKGLLRGVAKGARRSLKRFVNCFETFSLVNLEYETREGDKPCFLHSGKLQHAFQGLRGDFTALGRASYMVELTELLFPQGVAEPQMFDLLEDSLSALSEGECSERIPLAFELRALALGGYRINLEKCCRCGRVYKGEGFAVFVPERGAVACLKCRQPSAIHPSMGPETVKALARLQTGSLCESIPQELTETVLKEISGILKLHREYRLEQKLRTTKYIEEA
jgi:DNA repair protein RecO (recombination protein O)